MTTKKLTKLLALYLPYILLGLVATNFGEAWRLAEGKELGDKIMSMMGTIPVAFANPLPSLHPLDLLVGLCCGAGLRLAVYLRGKNAKKYRHGMEYGSARWGTPKDIEPFMAPKFADNIILTKTERLMMSNRPPDPKNARNKNVLVVGGSGSGKTRFWLKPNLLQCHSSYVVTDPKGSIVVECGNALLKNGYKLKILNTINFKKSMHYNPFAYVHSEKDILKLVTTLMTNTKGEGSGGDPFWEKSERLLLTALIAYLHYEAPVEEQNFATLLEMLNTMQVLEDDEEYQNPVDLLFEELAKKKPNSFAGRQYKLYKLAAGKTAKSILISCGARLAPFDIPQLREIMSYDELELDKLGDEKSALFFLISDTDTTYNFLVALAFSQMFNLLCERADNTYGGRLPYHVRVLWDEAANTGQVPGLEKIVAVIRSREISLTLFYQAMSQCKALYKDHSETIMGNMDSIVFLGGREASTLKDISENWLGKATISMQTEGRSRGQSESYSQNMQRLGRELMTTSEITTMPGDKCILQLRGLPPFLSPKYDLKKHPNYKYTAEFDKKKNAFRLESLFRHRPLRLKPEDEYTVYEVDGSDTDEEADLLNFDDLDSDEFV
ncbi:VirD4-like conjugal transfer protein, CD1115 family [Faecalibacterium sp.]